MRSVAGVTLPFEITEFEPRRRWAWDVAGFGATEHTVEDLGDEATRVGFGAPWFVSAYLAVCEVALRRIDELATR